jgi:hypothetical protein
MGFISFLKSLFSKKVENKKEKLTSIVDPKITDSVTEKPSYKEVLVEEKTTAKEIKAATKIVDSESTTSKPKRKYKPRKKKVENNTEAKTVSSGDEKAKTTKKKK